MLAYWYDFLDAPDDTDATVAMKAERTAIALNPAKRIDVVLSEQALHTRYGSPAEHAGQLSHVLSLMRLPFVSVAVIPASIQRRAIATIGFWIFDDNAVALETPTAAIKITRPNEIAQYAAMFAHPLRVRGSTEVGGRREAGDLNKKPRSGHVGQPGDSVAEEHCCEQHHDHRPDQPRVANQPVPDAPQKPRSPVP